MAKKPPLSLQTVDGMLKALLIVARAVDRILETHAVEDVTDESLSISKIQILRLLSERTGQTSSQVARFLGVSKPAVTQIVDAMVGSKLLVRKPTKQDRREVALELTQKGKTASQAVRRRQRHIIRSSMRELKETDVSRWVGALQGVAGGLARADHAFEHSCLQCGAHSDSTCVLVGGKANCVFEQHNVKVHKRRVQRAAKK